MSIQELIDELFETAQVTGDCSVPAALLEKIGPWSDGWGESISAWEAAGEPAAIDWPLPCAAYDDEEVADLFNKPEDQVTDEDRIAYTRRGLSLEEYDEYYSLIPVPVGSSSGDRGTICLIVEIQGQSGPKAIDSWLCLTESLELRQHGYTTFDEITDEMILTGWKK